MHSRLPFALSGWLLTATASCAFAQDADQVSLGRALTLRITTLRASPADDATRLRVLSPSEPLRWVEGERRNGYLRVIQERGPVGWVAESDLGNLQAPPMIIAAEAAAACKPTLAQCPTNGCEVSGSAHALLNEQKRRPAASGTITVLGFADFKSLQLQADNLVGQANELDAAGRAKLSGLSTSAGAVGEGARVRLSGFLASGPGDPRANNGGESVNCRLTGVAPNDFHIPMVPTKTNTEWQGIIVEIIPQSRPASWNLVNLKKAKQQHRRVLVSGNLFYDNMHSVNDDPQSTSRQPKRFSLWEIHRITGFQVCLKANNACDPTKPADWSDLNAI